MLELIITKSGGHSGLRATLYRIQPLFYWPHMRRTIKRYIQACDSCQKCKPTNHSPYGLLQPLPIPNSIWSDLSMDFITKLPPSNKHTTIMVVVDRYSKGARFISMKSHMSAIAVAQLFWEHVGSIFGIPTSIVSDRDPLFLSSFWKELWLKQGTKLAYSSAYHPQTDGQTERLNRSLEQYLRIFCHQEPKTWKSMLSWAEYHYNTTFHSAAGFSPYELIFGRKPPSLLSYVSGGSRNEAADSLLTQRASMLAKLRENLIQAQEAMKVQANKKRIHQEFEVGDWVLLKLQPYKQTSLLRVPSRKLALKFYGPFQIARRIGMVAYELLLPQDSKIHPVFHISLLKKYYSPGQQTIHSLPTTGEYPRYKPLAFVAERTILHNGIPRKQVLTQWDNLPPTESTWEFLEEMQEGNWVEGQGEQINNMTRTAENTTERSRKLREIAIPTIEPTRTNHCPQLNHRPPRESSQTSHIEPAHTSAVPEPLSKTPPNQLSHTSHCKPAHTTSILTSHTRTEHSRAGNLPNRQPLHQHNTDPLPTTNSCQLNRTMKPGDLNPLANQQPNAESRITISASHASHITESTIPKSITAPTSTTDLFQSHYKITGQGTASSPKHKHKRTLTTAIHKHTHQQLAQNYQPDYYNTNISGTSIEGLALHHQRYDEKQAPAAAAVNSRTKCQPESTVHATAAAAGHPKTRHQPESTGDAPAAAAIRQSKSTIDAPAAAATIPSTPQSQTTTAIHPRRSLRFKLPTWKVKTRQPTKTNRSSKKGHNWKERRHTELTKRQPLRDLLPPITKGRRSIRGETLIRTFKRKTTKEAELYQPEGISRDSPREITQGTDSTALATFKGGTDDARNPGEKSNSNTRVEEVKATEDKAE